MIAGVAVVPLALPEMIKKIRGEWGARVDAVKVAAQVVRPKITASSVRASYHAVREGQLLCQDAEVCREPSESEVPWRRDSLISIEP